MEVRFVKAEDICGKDQVYLVMVEGLDKNSQEVVITLSDEQRIEFSHYQECCEHVELVDFENDVSARSCANYEVRFLGIEESSEDAQEADDSGTWTFYRIKTNKGDIFMRWLGESNGYYGEEVTMTLITRRVI